MKWTLALKKLVKKTPLSDVLQGGCQYQCDNIFVCGGRNTLWPSLVPYFGGYPLGMYCTGPNLPSSLGRTYPA
jgi:hypothetical protein